MKKPILLLCCVFALQPLSAQEQLMTNAFNREATLLNGYWKYIVDPYENGFYNYRYEPFENQKNPGNGAFFTNAKRKGKADLVEYDFDKMDSLKVPGDWNSQKENLFYYEGSVFESIDATKVVVANKKLYVNREEGFIGTAMRKDDFVCECSDIDDIIVFRKNGVMQVVKVENKVFEKACLHSIPIGGITEELPER